MFIAYMHIFFIKIKLTKAFINFSIDLITFFVFISNGEERLRYINQ